MQTAFRARTTSMKKMQESTVNSEAHNARYNYSRIKKRNPEPRKELALINADRCCTPAGLFIPTTDGQRRRITALESTLSKIKSGTLVTASGTDSNKTCYRNAIIFSRTLHLVIHTEAKNMLC